MSLYGIKCKIGGLPCGIVMRGTANGTYLLTFEREYASLEAIEAIDWDNLTVEGTSVLPVGYGFQLDGISYNSNTRSWQVTIQVAEQYLGDVTGYQAQVEELNTSLTEQTAKVAAQEAQIAELQTQLAEADELAVALYEAQEASSETAETEAAAETETTETAGSDATSADNSDEEAT